MQKITVRAGSNIAFTKYWGVTDASLNIPLNSSVSMTLADAYTTTTVEWDDSHSLRKDDVAINGARLEGDAAARIIRHLDRIRDIASVDWRAHVVSENNFPIASGIASSASGFAALTVAACHAIGLELTLSDMSRLSRLASGSASRSLYGGFVQWDKGHDHESSVAYQLFPPDHWRLADVVAVVSSAEKRVSSEGGHRIASTSPLCLARAQNAERIRDDVVNAIARRDLPQLGVLIEEDAVAMHSVMMTGNPQLFYWLPGTLEVMLSVREWREREGLMSYFTIDAGPNVHVICEQKDVQEIGARLSRLESVQRLIPSSPGPEPQQLDQHLF